MPSSSVGVKLSFSSECFRSLMETPRSERNQEILLFTDGFLLTLRLCKSPVSH